ncbi:27173_t:CDS:2 [Gigaspora margarita]|uniref:27173_t:CDS:1 n=1 Tax=Gigaspora margarita TaxID=4874 RepID=A0ABM8VWP3_GIGMA|nr:27173_t:CDS:2 [Gigaspora margarita]
MNSIPKFVLNNGITIPSLGLGTYRIIDPETVEFVIKNAISSGYRLIDSAIGYRNEETIGKVVNELIKDTSMNLKREDFFITSKLPPKDQGYENCRQAFLSSLQRFNMDYFDLFLIHWPGTQKLKPSDPKHAINRKASYKALEELYTSGKIRAIGVSNYTHRHLTDLLSYCTIIPAVLQVELHPLYYQKELIDLCKEHKIQVQAYSSLGEGKLVNGEIEIPVIKDIAKKNNVSVAQILLRWGYQHGFIVIPKSVKAERIKENLNIFEFELSNEDMEALDSLGKSQTTKFCWDPTDIN